MVYLKDVLGKKCKYNLPLSLNRVEIEGFNFLKLQAN